MSSLRFALLASILAGSAPALAADWPKFHGPNHDNLCTETGLLSQWPEGGPKLLWTIKGLGGGYSSVAIVGGRLYTMGDVDDKQQVLAFDLATKKQLWATPIGPTHKDGPRCTPTVDGDLLYVLGTDSDLACLETATGKVRWAKNLAKEFGGKMMSVWKFSESPIVDGDRVVCTPGGPDALMVALNKKTGELIWKCPSPKLGDAGGEGAGYSSIVPAEIEGVRQYIQLYGRGLVSIEAATGKFLWGYNRVANKVANITSPIVRGNYVFATTSYKTGSALVKVSRQGGQWKADEVWWNDFTTFANHHGGVVLVGDYLYGGDGQNAGAPTCLEFLTGKVVWKDKDKRFSGGSAAVLYADGNIIFRYQKGEVALIAANPKELAVKGRFEGPKPQGPAWAHPVIVDKKLYLREKDSLYCYDVGK